MRFAPGHWKETREEARRAGDWQGNGQRKHRGAVSGDWSVRVNMARFQVVRLLRGGQPQRGAAPAHASPTGSRRGERSRKRRGAGRASEIGARCKVPGR